MACTEVPEAVDAVEDVPDAEDVPDEQWIFLLARPSSELGGLGLHQIEPQ
jgi:hypothetical protein